MSDDGKPPESRGPLPRSKRSRRARTGSTVDPGRATGAPDIADPSTSADSRSEADRPEELGERPTQLDSQPNVETKRELSGVLKRATLTRASSAPVPSAGPASATTYVGYVIDDRYEVEELIGRGGMGVVYRARHQVIDKLAAIKILLPTEDPDVIGRFVNEARAASAIGNAHIVDTFDFGVLPDGSTYFVMEYLEGHTLASIIREQKFLPIERCSAIAQQIAEGIAAAHKAKIIHRDLKPENIFIVAGKDEDFVKLLDFGIAKMAGAQNKLTRAGAIFGTPHYMSPEQAAGAEVDYRTDVYSLGVIMYEMASGRVPFDAENPMGLLTQHMYTQPTPLTELESPPQPIPVGYDAIVLKCLAKKAHDRYEHMAEVAADLKRLDGGAAPAAIVDLLRRSDEKEHAALVEAARSVADTRSRSKGLRVAAVLLGSTAVATAVGVTLWQKGASLRPNPSQQALPPTSSHSTQEQYAPNPATASKRHAVALVFSPIDAHVYDGKKDLGGMPVTIWASASRPKEVEVRRDGFYPERVVVDGSQRVLKVILRRIPGVEPAVPVPDAAPLPDFALGEDAGGSPLVDFGAAQRVDAASPQAVPDSGQRPPPGPPSPEPPALAATGAGSSPRAGESPSSEKTEPEHIAEPAKKHGGGATAPEPKNEGRRAQPDEGAAPTPTAPETREAPPEQP